MLETTQRDGRARVLNWQPSEGLSTATPGLIVPETSLGVPADADMVVTEEPEGRDGVIELVSDGTWFYPQGRDESDAGLVVRAPQPEASGVVQVLDVGDDLAVWHDAGGWAQDPGKAVPALIHARKTATMGRALWAPALGSPADYAVWAYAGVDLFDASPLILAALRGEALTVDGPMSIQQVEAVHAGTFDQERLLAFNIEQAQEELRRVRLAISEGRLRALAERRAYAHPDSVALLRRLDREHAYLEATSAVQRPEPVACMTPEALGMPEVERFRRRMRDGYRKPEMADVLVLLPCSARKPYRLSKTHRYFQRALDDSGIRHRVHEVMVTSPLGVVPRELEEVYPAKHYDVPVTGHWSRDEEAVIRQQVAHLILEGDYRHVIAHVGESTYTFLRDILPEGTLHTAHGRPSSKPDCDRLRDTLKAVQEKDPLRFERKFWTERKRQDLHALASYQFGPEAAAALVEGCKAHGRSPYVKLEGPDGQRGMATDKGLLSLTLDGAAIINAHATHRVHIGDFQIKKTGSLFAVGVESADPMIRPGDDVVVVHDGEVRGCGQALMSADEMTSMRRGVAVSLRHIVKGGGA